MSSRKTLIHERVSQAQRGQNPTVIGRLESGWAVLGDAQFPRGYSLLLPDPVVGSINELEGEQRAQFLTDMVTIGDALLAVTGAYRINYEIQGNGDPALHAHIFARYLTEDSERRKGPVWMYDAALRNSERFDPGAHAALQRALGDWLRQHGLLR
jgi:diadenosine tetraphosphate (Ap4A) HIT family hydrolase